SPTICPAMIRGISQYHVPTNRTSRDILCQAAGVAAWLSSGAVDVSYGTALLGVVAEPFCHRAGNTADCLDFLGVESRAIVGRGRELLTGGLQCCVVDFEIAVIVEVGQNAHGVGTKRLVTHDPGGLCQSGVRVELIGNGFVDQGPVVGPAFDFLA